MTTRDPTSKITSDIKSMAWALLAGAVIAAGSTLGRWLMEKALEALDERSTAKKQSK